MFNEKGLNKEGLDLSKEKILAELESLKNEINKEGEEKNDNLSLLKDIENLQTEVLKAVNDKELKEISEKIEKLKEKILMQAKSQLFSLKQIVLNNKKNLDTKDIFVRNANKGRKLALIRVNDDLEKAASWYSSFPWGNLISKFLKSIS